MCGARAYIGEDNVKQVKREPEDVEKELVRIQSLPKKTYRSLELPQDDKGAYIVYPNAKYFKRRNFQGQVRYTGPKGIKSPIFLYPGSFEHLVIIEGELNCISVFEVIKNTKLNYTLCSPGAASQFPKFIDLYKQFKRVTLILDKDASGVAFGKETQDKLFKLGKRADLILVDTDYNDVLQLLGPKALIELFKGDIE